MNKTKLVFLLLLLLLAISLLKIELIPIVRATATIMSDSWEDGSMSPEWEDCGDGGLGFKVVTHRVRTGSYAIQSDFDIGTDCRLNMTLYPIDSSLFYLTVYCYINGSDPSTVWADGIFNFFTGTGEGITVQYINYTGHVRCFGLFDNWSGADAYGTIELTKDTWHKLYFVVRGEGGQCDLYVDDVLDVSLTPANMAGKNHTEFWLDCWDNYLYDTFFDDLLLEDGNAAGAEYECRLNSSPELNVEWELSDAIQNPSEWTEVDPNNKLSQTSTRASWTDMIRNEACYLYTSETSGLSFTHQFQFEITDISDASSWVLACLWAVTNNTGRPYYTEVEPVVRLGVKTQNTTHFWLFADQGTGAVGDDSIDLPVDTIYYATITRVDPDFTFYIYSDDNRETLVDSLSLDVAGLAEEGFTFNYVETSASYDYTGTISTSGYVELIYFCLSTSYHTPWNDYITEGSRTLEAMEIIATRDAGQNRYRFDNWTVTNMTDSYTFTTASITLDIETEHNFTMNYFSYTVIVTASPEVNAAFTANGYAFTTPKTLQRDNNTHTFICTYIEISVNASYKYTFDHWSINGTGYYGSLSIDVEINGDTNLTIHYIGSWILSPYVPTFAHDAISGIWYFRSDTHTIHEILAYRLDFVNTYTATYDSRSIAGSYNISYGIRVWILDIFGNNYELSGGTPEAIVLRSSDAEGYQSAYFECPAHAGLIDAVQVNLYQRFNTEAWSLRRYFITDENLYIKLPASSWTIIYYTNRTTSSTTAYFHHGSTTFNSRILFQYYKANPWELALARLQAQNYLGFLFTPWTYYLGDIFWTLLLLFGIVTMYNRVGSLKPILALLWILGGVGSVLSSMIPALTLHIAWLMLAVAMGITLFKLIYR